MQRYLALKASTKLYLDTGPSAEYNRYVKVFWLGTRTWHSRMPAVPGKVAIRDSLNRKSCCAMAILAYVLLAPIAARAQILAPPEHAANQVNKTTTVSPQSASSIADAELAAFRREFEKRPSQFPNDREGFRRWQDSYRIKLATWLMNGPLPIRVPLEAQVIETADFPQFTLRRVEYRSQRDRVNTLLLSLPKNAKKAPLLLALHGHENTWRSRRRGLSPWRSG